MANVIETIIQVTSKGRDELEKQARGVEDLERKALKMGAAMVGVGTVVVGSIVKMASDTARYGDELAKTAKRLDTTVESLQELTFAAEQSGAAFEDIPIALRTLARATDEAVQGTAEYRDAFDALGITVDELIGPGGKLKSVTDILPIVADGVARADDQTRALAASQILLGRGALNLRPLLLEGAAGIQTLREEAQALGFVMSGEMARNAEEFTDAMNRARRTAMGLRDAVGGPLLDSFTELVDKGLTPAIAKMADFIRQNESLPGAALGVGAGLGAGGMALGGAALGSAAFRATPGPLRIAAATIAVGTATIALGASIGRHFGLQKYQPLIPAPEPEPEPFPMDMVDVLGFRSGEPLVPRDFPGKGHLQVFRETGRLAPYGPLELPSDGPYVTPETAGGDTVRTFEDLNRVGNEFEQTLHGLGVASASAAVGQLAFAGSAQSATAVLNSIRDTFISQAIGAAVGFAFSAAVPAPVPAQTGGIVPMTPGSSVGRDSVPMLLEPGERVLSREQNSRLSRILSGDAPGGGLGSGTHIETVIVSVPRSTSQIDKTRFGFDVAEADDLYRRARIVVEQ